MLPLFRRTRRNDTADGTASPPVRVGGAGITPGAITFEGTRFELCDSVEALCAAVEREGRGALRLSTRDYGMVLTRLFGIVRDRYGETSRQLQDTVTAPLICASCGAVVPASHALSLMSGYESTTFVGAAAGLEEFRRSGACRMCGGTESVLVYEVFSTDDVSAADVHAIRRHWERRAANWWAARDSDDALCDRCSAAVQRGHGGLSDSNLLCGACLDEALADALEHLRADPHYYGCGLLRTIRRNDG